MINIAPDENDVSFKSENVSFDGVVVTTDGVSQNFDRVFTVRAGTSDIRINLNRKDLSFEYNRTWTVADESGTAKITIDRIRNKDLSVDFRADGQTGSAANPIFNLGLPADNMGFFRPSGNNLAIGVGGNEVFRFVSNAAVANQVLRPATDATIDLGTAAVRWNNVRAAVGTINTSDGRLKTPVSKLTKEEIEAAKDLAREIGTFQFLLSLEQKGDAARLHVGMTVQRAIEIMLSHGLDPMRYGFICYDEWGEESEIELDDNGMPTGGTVITRLAGSAFGFRSDQLSLFILRGFEERLSSLEIGDGF
ncbi:tail fiber domain-containing protein [Agrobacterium tumefaciens]|uniref:tail fiber domain-containing protein n=1 Tax=Agrobacterium tumefaciens TaxID=358 RepID=UPI00045B707C|nr:tail fiber domain-containing protein [Agrobacterium tumefaciens]CDN96094.1 hypothetical protein BN949_05269 [Agrobacterium tumefaciens]